MNIKVLIVLTLVLNGCSDSPDTSVSQKDGLTRSVYSPVETYEDLNINTNIEGLTVIGYHLLSKEPVNNGTDYTFNPLLASQAEQPMLSVAGLVSPTNPNTTTPDSEVIFGDLYPGNTNLSKTSFTLRLQEDQTFSAQDINWTLKASKNSVTTKDYFPAGVQQRFEDLYLAGEFLPQFVLGDVNGDGTVNTQDQDQLVQHVEQQGELKLSCAAAGDLTGDAIIDENDVKAFDALQKGEMVFEGTDMPINLPLLYTQPSMPCDLNGLFFAASPAIVAGGIVSIFFLDPELNLEDIDIEVLAGKVERAANQLSYGLNFVTSSAMQLGEKIILKMTLPGRGSFLYAIPIMMPMTELLLSTVVDDDDSDDPRDTPPPAIYGEEDEGDDCELRDKGCEALLIDFFRYGAFYDKDMKTHELIEPQLKDLGCNVTSIYPSYIRAPVFGSLFTGGGSQNQYINNTNLKTLEKINKAIDVHAKKLATGRALGIQIVLGHGDNMGWGVSFSAPSGPVWGGNPTVSRKSLHQKVYDAEYSTEEFRVCGNIAMDYSCQSGYTPINIQTLNNTGSAGKTPAATRNHTLHAGYEQDVGRGEALIGADAGSVREGVLSDQVEKLSAALEAEKEDRTNENPTPPRFKRLRERIKDYSKSYSSSYTYYLDGGYDDSDFDHTEKLN